MDIALGILFLVQWIPNIRE